MNHAITKISRVIISCAVLICARHEVFGDSLSFNTIPASGDISGLAGSTVGWGFSITNESSSDWLITTNLVADPFLRATPELLFSFPIIAPGQTITQSFNANSPAGLYGLTWDANAPMGFTNTGDFVLSSQWWDGDPTNGGAFLADAPDTSVPYSARVSSASTVPEPSTLLMIFIAAALAFSLRSKNFYRSLRSS